MGADELAGLRNLGPASARRLRAVGIADAAALTDAGPALAYLRVARGFPGHTSRTLLWALFGALADLDWREVPAAERERLLAEVAALEA